jgi:hypothetical protein
MNNLNQNKMKAFKTVVNEEMNHDGFQMTFANGNISYIKCIKEKVMSEEIKDPNQLDLFAGILFTPEQNLKHYLKNFVITMNNKKKIVRVSINEKT